MLTFDIPKALLETTLIEKNSCELIAQHFVSKLLPKATIQNGMIVETNTKILTRVHHVYPSDYIVVTLPDGHVNGYVITQIMNNYSEFYLLGYLPMASVSNLSGRKQTRVYRDELKAFGLWNSIQVKRRE